jgi:glycogen operon protein
LRFCHALVHFRREQPTVRRRHFLTGRPPVEGGLPDVSWFGALGTAVDWSGDDSTLICLLSAPDRSLDPEGKGRDVMLLINATTVRREFILPPVAKTTSWRLFVDTGADSPDDVYPQIDGPPPPRSGRLALLDRSVQCYVAEN